MSRQVVRAATPRALFTALSINRVRAIPYQLIFGLPLLGRSLVAAVAERPARALWPVWSEEWSIRALYSAAQRMQGHRFGASPIMRWATPGFR